MKILIIEDEQALAQDIVAYLSEQNYICEIAGTYQEAAEKIGIYTYDCILLDLMLPGGNGMDLLSLLKQENIETGIIIISAKNATEDIVQGLRIGADDYLAKPFHHSELSARIHSVIRRKQFNNSNVIQQNEIKIDLLGKTVTVNNQEITLTPKEFNLLLFFIGNKNKVLSKGAIAEHLSGDLADMFDNYDFIYAHVKNLKKKLQEAGSNNYLKTVYGTGYKWEI
ncbi:DNA-binding response regulator [Chitinophaga silvatica]|uniref:DNA-binding response regulator n=1 Tax=Chitinophaga silvatica TaxID=2282649 RepID=A0A3E1YHS9_9BACT|nr:response regulator transcription factor [Chitinophaga silvatica]RFS26932.1 DNA-binding response regulator [Chitinophaga silvatica]